MTDRDLFRAIERADRAEALLNNLHQGLQDLGIEVKGDGDYEQMIRTVLLIVDNKRLMLNRLEIISKRYRNLRQAAKNVLDGSTNLAPNAGSIVTRIDLENLRQTLDNETES